MNRRTSILIAPMMGLLFVLLCSACATTTSNGAWYLQSDEHTASLYLAFIYTGEPASLTEASINGSVNSGWTCKSERSGTDLVPGQLVILLLPPPPPPQRECRVVVPVDATLKVKAGEKTKDVKLRVSTLLPSALPNVWLQCPPAWFRMPSPTGLRATIGISTLDELEALEKREALDRNNERVSALHCSKV